MSNIIRMARALYGPAYDQMADAAGKVKSEYVQAGGNPLHVYSPEAVDAMTKGGVDGLMNRPLQQRPDGSIDGPYVPTPLALANNMIERRAVPAVAAATKAGIHTVSSGVHPESGIGFAIGRAPSGHVVRVDR